MIKYLIFIIPFLLLSVSVNAEPVMVLHYTIYKNDSVSVENINFVNGTVKLYQSYSNEYTLKITDNKHKIIAVMNIPGMFFILTNPPKELNSSFGYQRLPWENNSKYINFYHNNKLIHNVDISDYICNDNNICEPETGENQINCMHDCPAEGGDTGQIPWQIILSVIIILILPLIILFYYKRKKSADILNVVFEK